MLGRCWTSGEEMLSPPDTPHRFGCGHVDDKAPVVFDRKCVGGVDDRCRAGLLDSGGALELVAGSQRVALVHTVFELVTREHRVDLAGLEGRRAGGATLETGQARRVEREDDG